MPDLFSVTLMKFLSICDCINRESRRVPDLSQNFEIMLHASGNLAWNKNLASFKMLTVLESGIVAEKIHKSAWQRSGILKLHLHAAMAKSVFIVKMT